MKVKSNPENNSNSHFKNKGYYLGIRNLNHQGFEQCKHANASFRDTKNRVSFRKRLQNSGHEEESMELKLFTSSQYLNFAYYKRFIINKMLYISFFVPRNQEWHIPYIRYDTLNQR
jgi:hypothetical protein